MGEPGHPSERWAHMDGCGVGPEAEQKDHLQTERWKRWQTDGNKNIMDFRGSFSLQSFP